MNGPMPSEKILSLLKQGVVIPAHPLALDANRRMDEKRQKALTRYYLDSGARGLAVGVHTTQFEIRDPKIGLFRPVLELAGQEINQFAERENQPVIKIAGIIGSTRQAVQEAKIITDLGYDIGLLSLAALAKASNSELLQHCREISQIIPLMGFYLQPAVGGRILDFEFWKSFAEIENVVAVKMAPFNRYQTLDVIRGVAESCRRDEIALYTGNDDNIVNDLLTKFNILSGAESVTMNIVGGLLGHWAVWTRKVVEIFNQIKNITFTGKNIPPELLALGTQITDCNAAFFDVNNNFSGVIAGIHEVLRRQGLLEGIWTLNSAETLSPGQNEQIDRVYAAYPHLNDDDFVRSNIDRWMTP